MDVGSGIEVGRVGSGIEAGRGDMKLGGCQLFMCGDLGGCRDFVGRREGWVVGEMEV